MTNAQISKIQNHLDEVFSKIVSNLNYPLNEIVQRSCFIAGGCLSSIHHSDLINDYDLYFTNLGDAMLFYHIVMKFKQFSNITGLAFRNATDWAMTFTLDPTNIFHMKTVQFVIRNTGSPEDVTSKFDFLHCQAFYYPYLKRSNFVGLDYKDLIYNSNAEYPGASFKRAMKYVKRGYSIDNYNMKQMVLSLVKKVGVDLNNKELLDQLGSMYRSSIE